jgi:hypothetical protein
MCSIEARVARGLCEAEGLVRPLSRLRICHGCGRICCTNCTCSVTHYVLNQDLMHTDARDALALEKLAPLIQQRHSFGTIFVTIYYETFHCRECGQYGCGFCSATRDRLRSEQSRLNLALILGILAVVLTIVLSWIYRTHYPPGL